MQLNEFYQSIGSDASLVIRRMGLTEKHLKKYLKKFQENQEYAKLTKAVGENDFYNIEWAAHTLKGVTSNLGLDILYSDFQKIVDSVRAGRNDEIPSLFAAASADYERVMELLAEVPLV